MAILRLPDSHGSPNPKALVQRCSHEREVGGTSVNAGTAYSSFGTVASEDSNVSGVGVFSVGDGAGKSARVREPTPLGGSRVLDDGEGRRATGISDEAERRVFGRGSSCE